MESLIDKSGAIEVDSDGNYYLTGDYFIPFTYSIGLAKLNSSGDLLWNRTIFTYSFARGIVLGPSNDIYISGWEGIPFETKRVILKYNNLGALKWQYSSDICNKSYGIAVDSEEYIYCRI